MAWCSPTDELCVDADPAQQKQDTVESKSTNDDIERMAAGSVNREDSQDGNLGLSSTLHVHCVVIDVVCWAGSTSLVPLAILSCSGSHPIYRLSNEAVSGAYSYQ